MELDRRTLLRASFGASFAAALSASPRQYHLRYAPRIVWLTGLSIVDQLRISDGTSRAVTCPAAKSLGPAR